MAKQKDDKVAYGWTESLEGYVLRSNPEIPNGSFLIVRKKDSRYWIFQESKSSSALGKSRQVHLCPAYIDDGGTSFDAAINKLKTKYTVKKQVPMLGEFIDKRILEYREQGLSGNVNSSRSKKTTQDKIYHLNKFKVYIDAKGVTLSKANSKLIRGILEEYTSLLKAQYKANSVKSHLSTIIQFFSGIEYLVNDENMSWVNYIDSSFISDRLRTTRPVRSTLNTSFTQENYENALNVCIMAMEGVWSSYLRDGKKFNHQFYGNRRSSVVQFVSFLQLMYGFRNGEVVRCYKSKEDKESKHYGSGGYSYLDEGFNKETGERDGYFFKISFKNKEGIVHVNPLIFVSEANDKLPYVVRDKEGITEYGYNVIDVMLEMFSNDKPYLISMDKTEYYRHFNNSSVGKTLKSCGINKTHDLRDFMINHALTVRKTPISDVARIVRNTVPVLERYYLHENEDIARKRMREFVTIDFQRIMNEARSNR